MDEGFRKYGPLGSDNMRRQQGRAFRLHAADLPAQGNNSPEAAHTEERLVFTGGKGKGNEGIGDAYAASMSISCSITGPGTVLGKIEWGTDGHGNVAYFDWLQGTVVHVAAAAVTITAQLVPDGADTALDDAADVVVGATIAYWTAGRLNPTRTIYSPIVDGALAVEAEIPPFASRLHVASDVAPFAVTAEFLSQAGTVLSAYAATDFVAGASVPIPNGAIAVRFTGGDQIVAAIFALSL